MGPKPVLLARLNRLGELAGDLKFKMHGFALGMTLALAAPLLAQGCAAGGQ
jgi:hypothetical protein